VAPVVIPDELLREALTLHGRVLVRARGHSMRPLIVDGSLVEVVPCTDPNIGDVIAFFRGRRLIVHRLVATGPSRLILRGDATLHADPPISLEQILGRVKHVVGPNGWELRLDTRASRWLGRAVAFVRS
jgi:phage repressor protein C with HTH and peptisase S24 domain